MVPVDRLAGHAAQNRIDQARRLGMALLLREFDALTHRRVRWDAVHVAELVDADAEGEAYHRVEDGGIALAEVPNEEIQLR